MNQIVQRTGTLGILLLLCSMLCSCQPSGRNRSQPLKEQSAGKGTSTALRTS